MQMLDERHWLLIGAASVAVLIALSVIAFYIPAISQGVPTTTVQSETFYFSVSNGNPMAANPLISYSGKTQGAIENATLAISCQSCYYSGSYNTTSVIKSGSGTATQSASQTLSGTGATVIVVGRNDAIHWSISWNITMVATAQGTFIFVFTCPNSTIPIVSLGPVTASGNGLQSALAFSRGTFSDIAP